MKRDYSFARSLFGFLSFIGWTLIVVGVIYSIVGASAGGTIGGYAGKGGGALLGFLIGMSAGLGLVTFGMLVLAVVQIGRAGIDKAENTQDLLGVARDQLAVLRTGQAQRAPGPFAAPASFTSRPAEVPRSEGAGPTLRASAESEAEPVGTAGTTRAGPALHGVRVSHSFMPSKRGDVRSVTYRDTLIDVTSRGAYVHDRWFQNLETAKEAIDSGLVARGGGSLGDLR